MDIKLVQKLLEDNLFAAPSEQDIKSREFKRQNDAAGKCTVCGSHDTHFYGCNKCGAEFDEDGQVIESGNLFTAPSEQEVKDREDSRQAQLALKFKKQIADAKRDLAIIKKKTGIHDLELYSSAYGGDKSLLLYTKMPCWKVVDNFGGAHGRFTNEAAAQAEVTRLNYEKTQLMGDYSKVEFSARPAVKEVFQGEPEWMTLISDSYNHDEWQNEDYERL